VLAQLHDGEGEREGEDRDYQDQKHIASGGVSREFKVLVVVDAHAAA
jgi:hypothetical protein